MLFLKLVTIIQLNVGGNAEDLSFSLNIFSCLQHFNLSSFFISSCLTLSNSLVLFHP